DSGIGVAPTLRRGIRNDPQTELGELSPLFAEIQSENWSSPQSRDVQLTRGGEETRACRAVLQAGLAAALVHRLGVELSPIQSLFELMKRVVSNLIGVAQLDERLALRSHDARSQDLMRRPLVGEIFSLGPVDLGGQFAPQGARL